MLLAFEHKITLVQFLIPPACAGILVGGVIMYTYMYLRLRLPIYLAITLLTVCALVFVTSEVMILSIGGWLHDRETGVQFHRLEQLSGVYFLFALPYFLGYLIKFSDAFKRLNRLVTFIGLGIAILTTVMAFALPDSFISLVQHKQTWLKYEADFARGMEGPLYHFRDLMLGIYIFYALFVIIREILEYRDLRELLFPIVGLLLAFGGAIIDTSFVYTGINFDFFPHEYFSRFTLGITMMAMFFMSTVTKRFIDAVKEVERSHRIISISEERYRRLVEGTNDCIFTLNGDLMILSANTAALSQLSIDRNRLNETGFYDFLYIEPEEKEITLHLVQDKVLSFIETGKPVSFKTMLKSRGTNEPKEYTVSLENIGMDDDRGEILMKAAGYADDTLMKYIDSEKMKFTIGNYLTAADEISKRLVLNIPKYLNRQDVANLRLGLREIIFNAIEHGNLNISFKEKTEATMKSDYIQYIHHRQKDDRYRAKKVYIEFSLTPERVQYKVTDEGNGFDYREMMEFIKNKADMESLAHGRGLTMAFTIFDEVIFNKRGNQVLLTKYFNDQAGGTDGDNDPKAIISSEFSPE